MKEFDRNLKSFKVSDKWAAEEVVTHNVANTTTFADRMGEDSEVGTDYQSQPRWENGESRMKLAPFLFE